MSPGQATLPSGMVVGITGAGQGIGRSLALNFARHGARAVVVCDINAATALAVAEEVRAEGCAAIGLAMDITLADDCASAVAQAVQAFGRLDVMLCNAGIMQVRPLMELEGDDWDRMMAVNVKGTFLTLQAAARHMLTQTPLAQGRPRGKIITMASIAGRSGAGPIAALIAPYRASKAAVISLTQSAAFTFAPHLTVNSICPGLVETDMWKRMDRDWGALAGLPAGEIWKQRVASIPMGRPQQPDDVANMALFLASPASDYMTGQSLNIDGGLMMN
jgi:NAD(P)-dependent dehydrogenase (short-subunit alcohol dehydrogenase family)